MYNRGASYDGEAQHSYQRSPRRRQQFYGNAVFIGERKRSSALIADESTDVTHKEQISVCIRFVSTKEDGKHFIHEEFLTLYM